MAQTHSFTEDLSDWAEKKRTHLGEPPTAEELLALRDGKLPEAEANHLRERLAVDPEWAKIYLELKRDTDYISHTETGSEMDSTSDVDEAWSQLSAKLELEPARVLPFPDRWSSRVFLGLAATLILGLGLAFFWGRPAPLPSGNYKEITVTGEAYRDARRIAIPKDDVGLSFSIDASQFTGTIEIRLIDGARRLIRKERFQFDPSDPHITFLVARASVSMDEIYQLRTRLSGDSSELVLETFTLAFED